MPIESEIKVFEDRIVSGQWRVEYSWTFCWTNCWTFLAT